MQTKGTLLHHVWCVHVLCSVQVSFIFFKLEPLRVSPLNALTISVGLSTPLRHNFYNNPTRRRVVPTFQVLFLQAWSRILNCHVSLSLPSLSQGITMKVVPLGYLFPDCLFSCSVFFVLLNTVACKTMFSHTKKTLQENKQSGHRYQRAPTPNVTRFITRLQTEFLTLHLTAPLSIATTTTH